MGVDYHFVHSVEIPHFGPATRVNHPETALQTFTFSLFELTFSKLQTKLSHFHTTSYININMTFDNDTTMMIDSLHRTDSWSAIDHDDDASWHSLCSVDAVEELLNDQDHPDSPLIIGKDLFVSDDLPSTSPQDDGFPLSSLWTDAAPLVDVTIATTISNDSSSHGDVIDLTSSFDEEPGQYQDVIENLLQEELLEPEMPLPVSDQQQQQQQGQMETVSRMMHYLCQTEPNRQIVQAASDVVRECEVRHLEGKKRQYQNLPGAIFERLIPLLGAQRFHEIYNQSQAAVNPPPQAAAPGFPGTLQFAIAYGIHIAQLSKANGETPEDHAILVERGVEAVNSMTDDEKKFFWDFIHRQQM